MAVTAVFVNGLGFIGREIIDLLVQKVHQISTLVRRESSADVFRERGVTTIIGTLDDATIIKRQTRASDVIIHTATSRHLFSVEAVLDGIRERTDSGQSTIYVHTSGATHLADNSAGAFKSDVIYDDNQHEEIVKFLDFPVFPVDQAVLRGNHALEQHVKIAAIIPPVIYGVGRIENRLSIQLPSLVRHTLKHRRSGQIGEGRSVWSYVHVRDSVRGYVRILESLQIPGTENKKNNQYWFCKNGEELSWNRCTVEYGCVLHAAGHIANPEPMTIPPSKYADLFGDYSEVVVRANSRNKATRLRTLGWTPMEKSVLESLVEDEIPIILGETRVFKGWHGAVLQ